MLSYIKGRVEEKNLDKATFVLEQNNIGYLIYTNFKVLSKVSLNSERKIHISCITKEDGQKLYGFINRSARDIFEILLTVSGVGPKAALSILNLFEMDELVTAVLTDKPRLISEAQGIGPKTAKRIILELQNKLAAYNKNISSDSPNENQEANLILTNLGYSQIDIDKYIRKASSNGISDDTESLVKYCLKSLSQELLLN